MSNRSLAEAIQRAQEGPMSALELVGAADQLKAGNSVAEIANLYKIWIDRNTQDPLLYAVLFNYSTLLTELRDFASARDVLERSAELNPDFAPVHINLGRVYEQLGTPNLSVSQWSSAIARLSAVNGTGITHKITALNQLARVLEAANQDEAAESMLKQSLEIDPAQREVVQHYLAARQRLCEWPLVQAWDRVTRKTLMSGISPLSMAVYSDDPLLQLAVNWHYNQCDVGEPTSEIVSSYWAATAGREGKPLRIGYISSDLREHAIGFLMAEMLELHNSANVEIFVYYCGIIPDDKMMQRIKGHVGHWTSIVDMNDHDAARRIADDGIQILVDVNGYTRDARANVVALRPAPIIVNWLGFPGSAASPYHNYIIADEWIIPPASEIYYSEKVLRLPCYQPNDRKRAVGPTPTRAEAGLPENAMVYCCFNGTQKTSRYTFDRWLTILNRVPNSVLWLLSGTEEAHNRLRDYAEAHGVAKDRLIFAPKKANPDHLARYPLADLFLDAAPYGAHTTASDAMWMGVPVLTFSGRAFASRVCGSLVRAAGLPELVCASADDYVDRAVALGKNRDALKQYREKLADLRDSCDLFNTAKLTEHLEALYQQMWADYQAGALPQPDLANLDVYLEVGIQQDHDAVEVQSIKDYEAWWQANLARRHGHRAIATDTRLWTADIRAKMERGS